MKSLSLQQRNYFIDRMSPLKKAVEKAEKAGVTSYLDVYKRMRIQKGMIGRGMHFIKAGGLDFKTLEKNGKSFCWEKKIKIISF